MARITHLNPCLPIVWNRDCQVGPCAGQLHFYRVAFDPVWGTNAEEECLCIFFVNVHIATWSIKKHKV